MSTYPYSPLVQPINLLNYSNITSSDDSSLLAKIAILSMMEFGIMKVWDF